MKFFSAQIGDHRTLYLSDLRQALDMEQKIVKALPDLIESSTEEELAEAFRTPLEISRTHESQIESLLTENGGEATPDTCKVIDGLIAAASDAITDVTDFAVRNIGLIGAAQQVEQHEIAVYGTLRRWADRQFCNAEA